MFLNMTNTLCMHAQKSKLQEDHLYTDEFPSCQVSVV